LSAAQTPAEPPVVAQTPVASSSPFKYLRFGATIEGYYQYNWNRPFDRVNLLRAYDTRANSFGIQQAVVLFESVPAVDEDRRFGARIDLQFGQATETLQGNPANEPRPNAMRYVWQAYGTYVFDGPRAADGFGKFGSNPLRNQHAKGK
jgi:hypothetical protein